MAVFRSPVFIGLVLVMLMGIAVYFRLWAIDSTFSQQESEILRSENPPLLPPPSFFIFIYIFFFLVKQRFALQFILEKQERIIPSVWLHLSPYQ